MGILGEIQKQKDEQAAANTPPVSKEPDDILAAVQKEKDAVAGGARVSAAAPRVDATASASEKAAQQRAIVSAAKAQQAAEAAAKPQRDDTFLETLLRVNAQQGGGTTVAPLAMGPVHEDVQRTATGGLLNSVSGVAGAGGTLLGAMDAANGKTGEDAIGRGAAKLNALSEAAGAKSAELIAQAKEGKGKLGQLAVDAGAAGTQMLFDLPFNAIAPGGSLAAMGVRSFGSASQEARQKGATVAQQLGYGAAVAGVEVLSEKLFDGLAGIYGKGGADEIVEETVRKLAKSSGGRRVLRWMASAGGEALEEAVSGIAQPLLNTIYNGKSVGQNYSEMQTADIAHDMLVGGILGGLGGAVSAAQTAQGDDSAPWRAESARSLQSEGNFTPANLSGAEARQTAPAAPATDPLAAAIVGRQTGTTQNAAPGEGTAVNHKAATIVEHLRKNASALAQMGPVAEVKGTEVPLGLKATDRVLEFLKTIGGKVTRAGFGDVLFSRSGVRRSFVGHGFSDAKIETMAAVPAVIRDGLLLDHIENYEGRGYDTYLFAAPIKYRGADAQVGVIVAKDKQSGRYYVHEVADGDGNVIMDSKEPEGNSDRPPADEPVIPSGSTDIVPETGGNVKTDALADAVRAAAAEALSASRAKALVKNGGETYIREHGEDAFVRDMTAAMERGEVKLDAKREPYVPDPAEHIDRRDAASVGSRSVKAFQYLNPELHEFYAGTAGVLMQELHAAEKGGQIIRTPSEYGQDSYIRTRRGASDAISRLIDEYGLSYAEIEESLQAIIDNHGAENFAAAKRVELLIDELLEADYHSIDGPLSTLTDIEEYRRRKARIAGAVEMEQTEADTDELPIYDMGGTVGAAKAGFETPGSIGEQRTSRIADTTARWTRYEGEATGLTRAEYDELFRYQSQTEEQSRQKADNLVYVEQDGEKKFLRDVSREAYDDLVEYLTNQPAWNGPMTDAAMLIKRELQGRSIRMEIAEDEYTNWLKTMQEHATASGQGVQAWAKWSRADNAGGVNTELRAKNALDRDSRLTDEQRREKFRRILEWDSEIEGADDETLRRIILDVADARGTTSGLSGKQSRVLRGIAERSLSGMTTEQLRQFAYNSTAAYATDGDRAGIGQKLKTLQVLNMLSNPKTAAKNLAGNTSFYAIDSLSMRGAAILDMAISRLTGTRSTAFERSAASRESREAITKAIQMSLAEVTMDVDMGGKSRYGTTSNRTFKADGKLTERILSAIERNSAYLLTTTDEAYKGAARATQNATQRLIDEGKIRNAGEDYAAQQAEQLALYRTFQNDGKVAAIIQGVHDLLNLVGVGDSGKKMGRATVHSFGLGDLTAPFTRVAGNLAAVGLDYSPVGAVKGTVEILDTVRRAVAGQNIDPARQAKAVSSAARGLTGTAIIYGMMLLAQAGLIRRADDEDDEDVARLNRAEGMTGTQVNVDAAQRFADGGSAEWRRGDTLIDLSNLEPLNLLLSLGVELANGEDDSILSMVGQPAELGGVPAAADRVLGATAKSAINAASDLPILSSVGEFAKDVIVYGDPLLQSLLSMWGKTAISGATPNIVAALAKGMDGKQRSTYSGDTLVETLRDYAFSRLPGLREQLPATVDVSGRETEAQGTEAERIINAMANPVGVNEYQQSDVSKEMERVRKATGETSFYPTTRKPGELTYTDKDGKEHSVTLTFEQRQQFQAACTAEQMAMTQAMMGSTLYRGAEAGKQAELLKRCYDYAYQSAKSAVLGDDAAPGWVRHAKTARDDLGIAPTDYLFYYDKYGAGLMSGEAYEKTKRMIGAGLTVDEWAAFRENADADGNGSTKKDEVTVYIREHFPREQWRGLFDAYKGNANWKNPF